MAGKAVPKMKGVRVFPPAPKGFDALAASKTDLARHGIPQRPDPRTQPGPAALWEQRMRRYRDFEHLEPELIAPDKPTEPVLAGFGLPPLVSCGFELSFPAPIVISQEPGQSRTSITPRLREGFRTTSIPSLASVSSTSTWK